MKNSLRGSTQFKPTNQREAQLVLLLMDKYTFIRRLGKGAFATVYEVTNKSLDRSEALKVLSRELTEDDNFLSRFKVEAKICASFIHPNIVTIFKFDQVEDFHFFTMLYVDGPPLSKFLKTENSLPELQTCTIIASVADALHYAHQRGVVHRDIKVSNIMLDQSANPYVTDFGIAKSDKSLHKTKTGMFIGSPYYVSPEQVEGIAVDHRADIYSLGVTLYALLTQQYPFEGDTALSVIAKRLTHDPIAPDLRKPDLNPELIRIITKTLQRNPDERYQSAADLAADLKAFINSGHTPKEHKITSISKSSPAIRTSVPKRSRWLALVAVLAICAIGAAIWFGVFAKRVDPRITTYLDNAESIMRASDATLSDLHIAQQKLISALEIDPSYKRTLNLKERLDRQIQLQEKQNQAAARLAQISALTQSAQKAINACKEALNQGDHQGCIKTAAAAIDKIKSAPDAIARDLTQQLTELERYYTQAQSQAAAQKEQQAAQRRDVEKELTQLLTQIKTNYNQGHLKQTIRDADKLLARITQLPAAEQTDFVLQKAQASKYKQNAQQKQKKMAFDKGLNKLVAQVESSCAQHQYTDCIDKAIAIKAKIESLPLDMQGQYASQKEKVMNLRYKAERAKEDRDRQLYTLERVKKKIEANELGSALSLLENALLQPNLDSEVERAMIQQKERIRELWRQRQSNIDTSSVTNEKVD